MKNVPRLTAAVLDLQKQRTKKSGGYDGTVVELSNVEQMCHKEVSEICSDCRRADGTQRTNKDLHPLSHFVFGCGISFLTQFARPTIVRGMMIDDIDTATAHFDQSKLRGFTDIVHDVRLTRPESKANVIEPLHEAQNRCSARQSLKQTNQ